MSAEPDITVFHPDRSGIRQVLGDLEAEIMELIWARPNTEGTTVRDVFEVLYERRRIAYTTVMNTMARLARKHILRAEKHPEETRMAYVYYPTSTQEEFVSRFVGRMLESLLVGFSGETTKLLDALPDREAAERVRRLIEELARRRAAEEGA